MAYSENILPKSGAYYNLNRASVSGSDLVIEAGGYAEIDISQQMLPLLTSKMLVVIHPSVFSNSYTSDAVQVELSILTTDGEKLEFLIAASETSSGVFNTEIELPEGEYSLFKYRISSAVDVTVYNWELCSEQADDLTAVIDGVEQTIPKLLYDYNMYAYSVGQKEITVGLISCFLLSPTDLQGHFTLSFFATERCNVHIRIKDNNVTELYSPQVFTVEKGYFSISVPHAYLHKLATEHSFSVTAQCTNGQLSIPVRGVLYTIDGGYLATRLLDPGVDIEDLSIKQLPTDTSPSELWAIGFESTRLILKKRAYSQLQRVNWSAVKDFGEGLAAGVEFPGAWMNRNKADKYTLETEETPIVFIVDLQGTLRAYHGETFETIYDIDTDVTHISVCQGFSSMEDALQTQGLVVTYVKNGNVYYKQWMYNEASGIYRWHAAEVLYDVGDALFVSVHRLPDYRLGFCVTHLNGTQWFITDRTYVGQTVKPEIVYMRTDTFILPSVFTAEEVYETIKWPAVQNEFEIGPDYYNGFIMTFDGPLVFIKDKTLETLIESIVVTVNKVVIDPSAYLVEIVENVLRVTFNEDVRANQTVSINFNCPYLLLRASTGCLATIKQDYSWFLPVETHYLSTPTDKASFAVSASVNITVEQIVPVNQDVIEPYDVGITSTLNAIVEAIIPSEVNMSDTVDLGISSTLNLTISQVGETPL